MSKTYRRIDTGEEFTGELPESVSIPVSEASKDNPDLIITKLVSASKGDAEYQDVLDAYMFMSGYYWE